MMGRLNHDQGQLFIGFDLRKHRSSPKAAVWRSGCYFFT